MKLEEKQLDSQVLFSGRIVKLCKDTVELPNGNAATREVVRHPGGVIILPVDDEGNVWMVEQYRYPMGRVLTEVPAGKLEYGEDPMEAAKRELSEEIGATAAHWEDLGKVFPTPGFCDEVHHLYLATGLTFGECHPDEDEFLAPLRIPFERACAMALDGSLQDSKTVIALLRAEARFR